MLIILVMIGALIVRADRVISAMPIGKPNSVKRHAWTDEELITEIDKQRSLMTAAATGGPKIDAVNSE